MRPDMGPEFHPNTARARMHDGALCGEPVQTRMWNAPYGHSRHLRGEFGLD